MRSILRRTIVGTAVGAACCLAGAGAAAAEGLHTTQTSAGPRRFTFHYETAIQPPEKGVGPIDVFLPLAKSDEHQQILDRRITASIPGTIDRESKYINEFWHGHVDKSDGTIISVSVDYDVERSIFRKDLLDEVKHLKHTATELKQLAEFLGPDKLVPVSGEILDKVRRELPETEDTPYARARAIYDYVVDTMEYKKVGTGWGNGDTYWACSQRYGNCTDFHSLFISLARAEKIPAKFEIGFPVPADKPNGTISGYHCWAEFHLPKIGWVPIDASEAKKDLSKRELYFGTHPADRLQFTAGRDLELGEGHKSGPLNFFIYPHVEVGGRKYDKLQNTFRFAEAPESKERRN